MKSQHNRVESVAKPDHSLAFTERGKIVLTTHRLQLTDTNEACSLSQKLNPKTLSQEATPKTGQWVFYHGQKYFRNGSLQITLVFSLRQ